jgi:Cu/Ag efflux protein CusF
MNKSLRSLFALSALVSVPLLFSACSKPAEPAAPAAAQTAAKRYPLKGVIVDIMADQSALMVKHEEIPGYMMAMTMMFKVDAATLKAAVKDQAITGTLVEGPNGFSLEDMKPAAVNDHDAIVHLLNGMFDRPEARLAVDPVVTEGDWAVADWTQGETGGRAVLRKHAGAWQIILCGGDGVRTGALLTDAGLAADRAKSLSAKLIAAEAGLDPERLKKISSFQGVTRMGATDHPNHPTK